MQKPSSSLSASSVCITFCSWSSCGLWSLSPNRPWSPGTIVVMWICQWLTSFSQWCSRLRRRAQCRQSWSTTRSPLSTSNTTTCTVSLYVEREREIGWGVYVRGSLHYVESLHYVYICTCAWWKREWTPYVFCMKIAFLWVLSRSPILRVGRTHTHRRWLSAWSCVKVDYMNDMS